MKILNLKRKVVCTLIATSAFMIQASQLNAQHVNMYFNHCALVAPNEIQFDVEVQNDGNTNLAFNSIVVRFNHQKNIATSSDLSWEYIQGSSSLKDANFPGLANYRYIPSKQIFTSSSQTTVYDYASAPVLEKNATLKIGRYRVWVKNGVFNQGANIGLSWDPSAGCVFYENGSKITTSFNTAQKVTLVTPCALKVPGVEVSPIAQFSGKTQEAGDELNWVISADNENSVYNLYQSNDGVNYQFISKIDSKATSMSAEKNSYSYMNTLASKNRNYYKLEQVSKNNGAILNSKIVILERRGLDAAYQVYPNPTSDVINLSINAAKANLYKIIITDMNGRQLKQIEAHGDAGINTINIDIADYAAGLYSLQLFENNKKVYDQQVNKIK